MTREEIVKAMKENGAMTIGEAAKICPDLFRRYIEAVRAGR
jgi:hypothetical protein